MAFGRSVHVCVIMQYGITFQEWDPTNFLIDLSGGYANCKFITIRGSVNVPTKTPEGDSIGSYVDYTDGSDADVNAVNVYLKRVVDRWMHEPQLSNQVRLRTVTYKL